MRTGLYSSEAVGVIRKSTEFLSIVFKFLVPVQIYVAGTWVGTLYVDCDLSYTKKFLPLMMHCYVCVLYQYLTTLVKF